jgi:arsenite methyltransferase
MPDVYADVDNVDPAVAEQLGDAMELRARDPQQQAMLASYLDEMSLPAAARVLEIGCGTGAISRTLAARAGVGEVVGVEPATPFITRARRLGAGIANLTFEQADGRDLPGARASFDAVVIHTVLSHVPGAERVLLESFRVLRPAGWLAVFDGDYATVTVATSDHDPVQAAVDAFCGSFVHDRWLIRHLSAMVADAGFEHAAIRSHGYAQLGPADYMISIVDRGADLLASQRHIGTDLAAALKAEARRRIDTDSFFGHIAYASVTARKPTRTSTGQDS